MRRIPSPRFVLALAFCAAMTHAAVAHAVVRIVCPVCGQVFDESTRVCPNDGSDLVLVGKREEVGKEPGDTDTADAQDGGAEPGQPVVPGYKRHDKGGRRQRTAEPVDETHNDRRSRFAEERRGGNAAAEQARREERERRQRFTTDDERLRAEFDSRRAKLRNERELAAEEAERARLGLATDRTRIVHGLAAPLVSLGYRVSFMGEGRDAGPVHGAEIDVNPSRTYLRAGFSTFVGVRALDRQNELLFMEHVTVGVEWPWRFAPFALLRAGIGGLASRRFGEDSVALVRSIGTEVGVDCHLGLGTILSPSVGYVRYMVNDAYWNSVTAKISIGF
ncbi:MAG: hypothetical protein PHU25_14685 [Deltaproteobacteria bacterium]|nr:hypothetical protein [Deltaproteobacteria bacterium]